MTMSRCAPQAADVANSPDDLVRYVDAARRVDAGGRACATDECSFGSMHYDDVDDVPDLAVRASLGCGNPVAVAELQRGDVVLDLGSGAGLDVLLSARRVGPAGFVYGLDATGEMVELARRSVADAGVENVELLHGTIERIPLDDASVDVVISNCVIVLSTDKDIVFAEIARVLRFGGRVGISDIVRDGDDDGTASAVDCATTAITIEEYRAALRGAGFVDVSIQPTDALGGGLSSAIVKAVKSPVLVRPMRPADWPAVERIYAAGIAARNATFETSTPSWERWDRSHLAGHRLVAVDPAGEVVGWAALSPVSERCAYAGVAENSVYVHHDHRGKGIGAALLDALITGAEQAGFWTVQTGIFPENQASLALHERAGFRVVGRRERIGRLDGVWRDVYFLERRSNRL
jgi:L-amino acid N-acyltransferase YncA